MLFLSHYDQMYLLAKMLLHDDEESRDVVSEVFARILDSYLDVHPDSARHFLLTCVRNKCLKVIRSKQVRERARKMLPMDDEAVEMLPIEPPIDQLDEVLAFCHEGLTEQTQRVFLMRHQQQMKYADIAQTLHISEGAVYKHLAQALKQIKNHFNPSTHNGKE